MPTGRNFYTSTEMAAISAGSSGVAHGFSQEQIARQRKREEVAHSLRPLLEVGKIDRELLRDKMQRVAILQLIESVERGQGADVRKNMAVLADLSGLRATKITVEVPKGHTDVELGAFRAAGKVALPATTAEEANGSGSEAPLRDDVSGAGD